MIKTLILPNKYVQGPGAIGSIGKYLKPLGIRPFFIGGESALSVTRNLLLSSIDSEGMTSHFEVSKGFCTRKVSEELSEVGRRFGADTVVGVGGGSVIDTAKAVSHELNVPIVIVPTIASTDAPCTALSVQYTEDHGLDRFLILRRNPDLIIVDSEIIARAPTRFFVAGMGDALATWFEAHTCTKSSALNLSGGFPTTTVLALASLCLDILLEFGPPAKLAVDRDIVTPAVEKVIEATVMLSGIGFESGGLAAAHPIHLGLSFLEGTKDRLHGELVAFSTLAQLVLEDYAPHEIKTVIQFCKDVGLPCTLKQLGVMDASRQNLQRAAEVACEEGQTTHNTYFPVTADMVVQAIIGADVMGQSV